jgi:hypothetical protein
VRIRKALGIHMPQLADTRSPLEERFLCFCEAHHIELPHPNFVIGGKEIDAVWPDLRLAVELDGREEHGTPAAVVEDRRRELAVRNAGYDLIRYGSEQLNHQAEATAADLRAAMDRRSGDPLGAQSASRSGRRNQMQADRGGRPTRDLALGSASDGRQVQSSSRDV